MPSDILTNAFDFLKSTWGDAESESETLVVPSDVLINAFGFLESKCRRSFAPTQIRRPEHVQREYERTFGGHDGDDAASDNNHKSKPKSQPLTFDNPFRVLEHIHCDYKPEPDLTRAKRCFQMWKSWQDSQQRTLEISAPEHVSSATYSSSSMFEGLPVEILITILGSLDGVETLKKFIRTSPSCYNVYQANKRQILASILQNGISDDLLYEANAVYQASFIPCRTSDRKERVKAFLAKFRQGRNNSFDISTLDVEALSHIARFHSLVKTLSGRFFSAEILKSERDYYSPSWLQNKSRETGPMSKNEELRIMKAFCRFELYQLLFPDFKFVEVDSIYGYDSFQSGQRFQLFLSLFQPWERVQIVIIGEWMRSEYRQISRQCASRGNKIHPGKPVIRCIYHPLYSYSVNYLFTYGLSFFHTMTADKHPNQLKKKLKHLPIGQWPGLNGDIIEDLESIEMDLGLDQMETPFESDEEGPPLGWVRGHCDDLIFWDAERLGGLVRNSEILQ